MKLTAREIIAQAAADNGWTVFKAYGYVSTSATVPTVEYRKGSRFVVVAFDNWGERVVAASYGNPTKGWTVPAKGKRDAVLTVLAAADNRQARAILAVVPLTS